jgi:nucleoside-diphosphate-sugar epimerase
VTGATGVLGRSAVPALVAAGHEVVGVARTPAKAELLVGQGAEASPASLFDHGSLLELFRGCDAVVNLASSLPVGRRARSPWAWRTQDRLRIEGVRHVVLAAREAGVRRLVQESVSWLYADQGSAWIDESSPVEITRATEPASMGEFAVQEFSDCAHTAVVLRFGGVIGDDAATRWSLRAVAHGRPIGYGDPDGWAHVLHADDVGPCVAAALEVPSGVYNVGAEPVLRRELVAGFATAAGRGRGEFVGPMTRRLGGTRAEPLGRSLRVDSSRFTATSGWGPRRSSFDASWLAGLTEPVAVR